MGKLPEGVDPAVLILNTVEQVGLQDGVENELVAPDGSPETANETTLAVPDARVAAIVLVVDDPAVTDRFPEFASETLKVWLGGVPPSC